MVHCQYVLLYLIETWKKALDNKLNVGVITTDLSSAFDCLSPSLLYYKLLAYGFTENACNLIYNYLTNRFQRVQNGNNTSSWQQTLKGTPQGSKLGPVIWNYYSNDIFYVVPNNSMVKYADNNTLFSISNNNTTLCNKIH